MISKTCALNALMAWLLIGGCHSAWAQSPSLWERRDRRMVNLISDVKARQPGDLLFVIIDEQSDVENRDQRLLRKQGSSEAEGDANYGLSGGLGMGSGGLSFDHSLDSSRQFNGNTQYRSERGFTDRFAVRVLDRLPNGNLLVSGVRKISLERDSRLLRLTGIVRDVDISANNLISSRMVSDLKIHYESNPNEGAEPHFINQGWLARKFNRWWPY